MSKSQKNSEKYSLALRLLHWTGVPVMLVVYASIFLRKLYERGTEPFKLMSTVHVGFGALLMVWLFFRLAAYSFSNKPPIAPEVPAWQKSALKLMLGIQWGLMVVLPLSGWLMGNAKGRVVNVFGMPLPSLIEKNDTFAKALTEGHIAMAYVLLVLIVLHTSMALWHHFFKKDNAIRRML